MFFFSKKKSLDRLKIIENFRTVLYLFQLITLSTSKLEHNDLVYNKALTY